MALHDLPWGEWLTSGGLGAAVMKGGDFLLGRKPREVKALGDTIAILSEQHHQFREDLVTLREDHQRCEDGRREDRKKIEALEDEVRRFMAGDASGRVAAFGEKAPSDG